MWGLVPLNMRIPFDALSRRHKVICSPFLKWIVWGLRLCMCSTHCEWFVLDWNLGGPGSSVL